VPSWFAATLGPPPIRIVPVLDAVEPVPTTMPTFALPNSGLLGRLAISRLATLMIPALATVAPLRARIATLLVV
jgi:hypothetical protein